MKQLIINKHPFSFTMIGIILLAISIPAIINVDIGGWLESAAWFMCGMVACSVVMQVVLPMFCPEYKPRRNIKKGRKGK